MREGKIAYFEDDPLMAEAVIMAVGAYSADRHRVVAQGDSLESSLDILNRIAAGEIDANLILSDANLSRGASGADAREIIRRVRELRLGVRTLILSNQDIDEIGVNVDAFVHKSDRHLGSKLIEAIDNLDEPQINAEA